MRCVTTSKRCATTSPSGPQAHARIDAARLAAIDAELETADADERAPSRQERRDLQAELASIGEKVDISALEEGFVEVAKAYSDRQGISYAAWREVGVDAAC